jgi:hypothetical protein
LSGRYRNQALPTRLAREDKIGDVARRCDVFKLFLSENMMCVASTTRRFRSTAQRTG